MNCGNQSSFRTGLVPVLYLWPDLALYIGQLPPNENHSIAVDTFSLNLDGQYEIHVPASKTITKCRSVFWRAGCLHKSVYGDNVMVFLMHDPGSLFHNKISARMENKFQNYGTDIDIENQLIKLFSRLYTERPELDSVYQDLIKIFDLKEDHNQSGKELDARVIEVMRELRKNPGDHNSMDSLAKKVNLSVSRLGHLFKEETGITVSSYRIWCRITSFLSEMSYGGSMTDVLYQNGFNDSSHLCKVFKDSIGINPSAFLGKDKSIDIRSQIDLKPRG